MNIGSRRYWSAAFGFVGVIALGAGAFLLSAPFLARKFTPPHPAHESAPWGKPPLSRTPPSVILLQLEAMHPVTAGDIAEASKFVGSAMASFWPAPGVQDLDLECGFVEDPHEWVHLHLFGGAAEPIVGYDQHITLERSDWRMGLLQGVGFCSQQSLVLSGFLRERGVESTVMVLDGHVVVAAKTPEGEWVLDPDYGVALPFPLAEAEVNKDRVRSIYRAAGYGEAQTEMVVDIYGAAGNARYAAPLLHEPRTQWYPYVMLVTGLGAMAWSLRLTQSTRSRT